MFFDSQRCDPKLHALSIAIARACLKVIENLLRDDEKHLALEEFYRAARCELEADEIP